MTLDQLVSETLVQKNRRMRQAKCRHEEVYSCFVDSPDGSFGNAVCLDCGQALNKPILANKGLGE